MNALVLAAELLAQGRSGTRRSSGCSWSSRGIGLFCGSIYLLLGTNLGARLGFLVAFTGLMGSW